MLSNHREVVSVLLSRRGGVKPPERLEREVGSIKGTGAPVDADDDFSSSGHAEATRDAPSSAGAGAGASGSGMLLAVLLLPPLSSAAAGAASGGIRLSMEERGVEDEAVDEVDALAVSP